MSADASASQAALIDEIAHLLRENREAARILRAIQQLSAITRFETKKEYDKARRDAAQVEQDIAAFLEGKQ